MAPTSCARPGCQGSAVAWLTYDYGAQQVWLDDRPGPAGDQWGLCQGHAARLRVPRGWSQVDRRAGAIPPGTDPWEPPAALVS
ncbi:DUF3499 family protein [Acidimicrobiaceae bacterium USS-CC1]|uniref:DUF3499 family protein n=1 Tax=Acidiferrimicrobium australe TaxID=2664430 RepID=A0ABW9QXF4_9ACTN|nr:DUF3499 family protein [Acidiferrimicrobium australe]